MKPPRKLHNPSSEENQEPDFGQELEEVERSLVSLKQRYNQVQSDQQQKAEWQQQKQQLKDNKHQTPEIKAQLRQIQKQLEVLEINLESQLFSWRSLKKPFWQAVRFGGMGVIIGWILKSCVG
jgi:septal ring factor EnvC (AmiA/AmiB activator)